MLISYDRINFMSTNNKSEYNVIDAEAIGEYEEKKSKFIAHLMPVNSESEAVEYINQIKKKYYDARHNCTAMIIGENNELIRSSDDGEPQGTAGKPMLEVLTGAGLTNVVTVVTRYFGGVLLGTGGLVRAYQAAVKDALNNTRILTMSPCVNLAVNIPYSDVNSVQYFFGAENIMITSSTYLADVTFEIRILESSEQQVLTSLSELTKARAKCTRISAGFYPI